MKRFALSALLILASLSGASPAPDKEQVFLDTYRRGFEAQDLELLSTLLYTEKADSYALEYYKKMLALDFGRRLTKIELVDIPPQEFKGLEIPATLRKGLARLSLRPVKSLVLEFERVDENGSSESKHKTYVAEHEGRLVIPLPVVEPR